MPVRCLGIQTTLAPSCTRRACTWNASLTNLLIHLRPSPTTKLSRIHVPVTRHSDSIHHVPLLDFHRRLSAAPLPGDDAAHPAPHAIAAFLVAAHLFLSNPRLRRTAAAATARLILTLPTSAFLRAEFSQWARVKSGVCAQFWQGRYEAIAVWICRRGFDIYRTGKHDIM
jgi:hypothetical protein